MRKPRFSIRRDVARKKTNREADYDLLDKLIKTILIGFSFFKILLVNLFKYCR